MFNFYNFSNFYSAKEVLLLHSSRTTRYLPHHGNAGAVGALERVRRAADVAVVLVGVVKAVGLAVAAPTVRNTALAVGAPEAILAAGQRRGGRQAGAVLLVKIVTAIVVPVTHLKTEQTKKQTNRKLTHNVLP